MFKLDNLFVKQEIYMEGLDLSVGAYPSIKIKLTPQEEQNKIKEIINLNKKMKALNVDECNCFFMGDTTMSEHDHICEYHDVKIQISILRKEVDIYGLKEFKEKQSQKMEKFKEDHGKFAKSYLRKISIPLFIFFISLITYILKYYKFI